MPTSHPGLITPIMTQILWSQPPSILDIGVGQGKFGALSREYLDIWQRRYKRSQWKTIIDGVEIFEEYKNPSWDYYYNRIYIGDILDVIKDLKPYDTILFLEVIEHMSKEDGLKVLQWCQQNSQQIFFSYTNSNQSDAFGNEHERHISTWNPEDFNFMGKIELLFDGGVTKLFLAKKE